eukprot:29717-Chlamydomonas_euryale.AAC.15
MHAQKTHVQALVHAGILEDLQERGLAGADVALHAECDLGVLPQVASMRGCLRGLAIQLLKVAHNHRQVALVFDAHHVLRVRRCAACNHVGRPGVCSSLHGRTSMHGRHAGPKGARRVIRSDRASPPQMAPCLACPCVPMRAPRGSTRSPSSPCARVPRARLEERLKVRAVTRLTQPQQVVDAGQALVSEKRLVLGTDARHLAQAGVAAARLPRAARAATAGTLAPAACPAGALLRRRGRHRGRDAVADAAAAAIAAAAAGSNRLRSWRRAHAADAAVVSVTLLSLAAADDAAAHSCRHRAAGAYAARPSPSLHEARAGKDRDGSDDGGADWRPHTGSVIGDSSERSVATATVAAARPYGRCTVIAAGSDGVHVTPAAAGDRRAAPGGQKRLAQAATSAVSKPRRCAAARLARVRASHAGPGVGGNDSNRVGSAGIDASRRHGGGLRRARRDLWALLEVAAVLQVPRAGRLAGESVARGSGVQLAKLASLSLSLSLSLAWSSRA